MLQSVAKVWCDEADVRVTASRPSKTMVFCLILADVYCCPACDNGNDDIIETLAMTVTILDVSLIMLIRTVRSCKRTVTVVCAASPHTS